MARQTSIDAYNSLIQNGVIKTYRQQVYDYVYKNGPCTAKQIHVALSPNKSTSVYHQRLSELREMKMIDEIGSTTCNFTNQTVILWDVTDKLPTPITKKETNKEKIAFLEGKIALLEERLSKCNCNKQLDMLK